MTSATIQEHGIRIDLDSDAPGATREEIEAYLAESLGGFTPEQLGEAFGAVADAGHWKNPVDAVVAADMRAVLDRAIPYHTGTPASFREVEGRPGMLRVTADGYFAGPCN